MKLLGTEYAVYINRKLVITGIYMNRWAAWLAAVSLYGLDKPVGSVKVEVVR